MTRFTALILAFLTAASFTEAAPKKIKGWKAISVWEPHVLSEGEIQLSDIDRNLLILETPSLTVGLRPREGGDYLFELMSPAETFRFKTTPPKIVRSWRVQVGQTVVDGIEEKVSNPDIFVGDRKFIHLIDPQEVTAKTVPQMLLSSPANSLRDRIRLSWQNNVGPGLGLSALYLLPFTAGTIATQYTYHSSTADFTGMLVAVLGFVLMQQKMNRDSRTLTYAKSRKYELLYGTASFLTPILAGGCIQIMRSLGIIIPEI